MKVRYLKAPIHMADGSAMGGYVDRRGLSQGVLDPLELNGVVVDDGTRRFALVVVDLVSVGADLTAAVRREARAHGIDAAWLLATHTHAGPAVGTRPGGGSATPKLVTEAVVDSFRRALLSAPTDGESVTLSPFRFQVRGVGGRRNDRTSTDALPVDGVRFVGRDGLVGIVVITPVHPTVLGSENCQFSADLAGGIRRAFSSRFGCWTVAVTGAAGDISTRYQRREQSPAEVDRLAAMVVDGLAATADGDEYSTDAPGPIIGPTTRRVAVATRSEAELDRLLAERRGQTGVTSERADVVLAHGVQLAEYLRSSGLPESIDFDIETVRLGAVDLVALPCEPFLEVGEHIAATGPRRTMVLGYANDYLGYLPWDIGELSYEVLATPFATGSAERVVSAARDLLEEDTHAS